jgi:hypothetical protein
VSACANVTGNSVGEQCAHVSDVVNNSRSDDEHGLSVVTVRAYDADGDDDAGQRSRV